MRKILVFVAGIIAGTAIGAAVSFLLTPASGDELRQGARQRFQQILDESARAAAARRVELKAELDQMTHPPKPDTPT